ERAYYASLGYRMSSWMPYVTFERLENRSSTSLVNELAGLSPQLAGGIYALDDDLRIYTLGARYDFHPSAALKVEFSRMDEHRQLLPGAGVTGDANLIGFVVDAVF
ncbi:MAG: hypothetical protein LPK85_10900, partial [Gammaproteobacteria bacterium]|nr:hypothetical protein [Gammaproteobacteria bacterium]